LSTAKTVLLPRVQLGQHEGSGVDQQQRDFIGRVAELGVRPIELPVVQCVLEPRTEQQDAVIRALCGGQAGWIVFLSPTAVRVFHQILSTLLQQKEPALPATLRCAVQGPGTAAALSACFGRTAACIPDEFVAEHFAHALASVVAPGDVVVIPHSAISRAVVTAELSARGCIVHAIPTYRPHPLPLAESLWAECAGSDPRAVAVLFMSASAVEATVLAFSDASLPFQAAERLAWLRQTTVFSIGPHTSAAVVQCGLTVAAEAHPHSQQGALLVLQRWAGARGVS
jgi:uroporphyrinogen-III synthase